MKVLLVQTAFLGDVVCSTALLPALHQIAPKVSLTVLTTPLGKQLIERDPLVESVICFDKRGSQKGVSGLLRLGAELRKGRFERAYALQRSFRTGLLLCASGIPSRIGFSGAPGSLLYTERRKRRKEGHVVEKNLDLILPDLKSDESEALFPMRLFPPPITSASERVREVVEGGRYLVLSPGSVWKTKRWHWEHYREVALWSERRGVPVVIVGSPEEREIAEQVAEGTEASVLAGETSLGELMLIIKEASAIVCNDSLALHIASAFQIPTTAIFCATSPEFGFGPWRNPKAEVRERQGLACKPCARHGGMACPVGTEACMRELKPEMITETLKVFSSETDQVQSC